MSEPEFSELPELIDTHCHLNHDYGGKTAADLVREALAAGVTTLVTIGTDLKTMDEVQAISARHPNVYHAVGVHPHDAVDVQDADLARIEAWARHPKCRAVGEIGLDYHYDHSPRDTQRKRLEDQLDIALRVKLPVVIHSREGESDLLAALARYASRVPQGAAPGIIHCFSGTYAFAEACVKLGFYISFSGILTFKNAEEVRASARALPLDRLLVETDAPFLAPVPYRGKKCEPAMVRMTALKLAEVKGVPIEEIARATTANARSVFRLPATA